MGAAAAKRVAPHFPVPAAAAAPGAALRAALSALNLSAARLLAAVLEDGQVGPPGLDGGVAGPSPRMQKGRPALADAARRARPRRLLSSAACSLLRPVLFCGLLSSAACSRRSRRKSSLVDQLLSQFCRCCSTSVLLH